MDPGVNVESREGWDVVAAIATPDDHTVVFRLKHPYPDFASETFYDESVLPEHLLRASRGARFQSARFHRAPVGSGPFKFDSWSPGSHLSLVANRDYYGTGPHLDAIIFKFVPTENALLVQLKTGEIDMFDNANISFIGQLEALPGIRVYRTPMLMYEHLDLNTENAILRDVRVRRALSYATNKAEIADRIYNGLVRVAALDEFEQSHYYSHSAKRERSLTIPPRRGGCCARRDGRTPTVTESWTVTASPCDCPSQRVPVSPTGNEPNWYCANSTVRSASI